MALRDPESSGFLGLQVWARPEGQAWGGEEAEEEDEEEEVEVE